ncbi:MAG: alpha/beta hydrolase [Sphingomonadales bacterium]|nr:alpha/beta hydrolase [Sphingomonadales bacterium]
MSPLARRDALRGILAVSAGLALARPGTLLAAEPAGGDAYLRLVHPDLRATAARIMQMLGARPDVSAATLANARAGMAKFVRPRRADVPVERRVIAVGKGLPDVAVYVVNAAPGAARPAILHTHGGGFVQGTADSAVRDLQDLCAELGVVAVTVDYRLSPEVTWKVSVEENYAGLKWLHDNAAALGADPARIALLGESAGGGHAALLAIAARDRGEVPVAFQCLVYPMLDDRTGSSRVPPPHVGHLIWTPGSNRFGWAGFLGMEPGGDGVPAAAVPARTASLAGLPPAFIGVGTLDLFHDEDVEYARRLNDAGVPTELIVVPGAFHGFDVFGAFDPSIRISAWFNAAKKTALRQALGIAAA